MNRLLETGALALLACVLCACGGGGGGSGGNNPPAGTFSLNTDNLVFATNDSRFTPPSQQLTATATGVTSGTLFIRVEVAGNAVGAVTNIVVTGPTSGSATVVPISAATLGAGTYTSTITVYACTSDASCQTGQLSGSPRSVNVTYTIAGLASSAKTLSYTLRNESTDQDSKASLIVTGHPSQTWTASTNRPWLTFSTNSGSTASPANLQVSIDESATRLKNGTHSARVTLTPTTGAPLSIPVDVTVDRTQIDFVSPNVAVSGASREVIIHGDRLDAGGGCTVRFGAQAATACTVISANEIHATHPALAEGTYSITLQAAASALSLARLHAVDPIDDASIAVPAAAYGFPVERPHSLRYDARRQTLYLINSRANQRGLLNAYTRQTNGQWLSAIVGTDLAAMYDIRLAADGDTLLLSSQSITSEASMLYLPLDGGFPTIGYRYSPGDAATMFTSFAIANDGNAIVLSATQAGGSLRSAWAMTSRRPDYYSDLGPADMRPPSIRLTPSNSSTADLFIDGSAGASLDGSRVLLASGTQSAGTHNLYSYDPRTGHLSDTGRALKADSIQLDRTGNRIVLNHANVYDGTLQLLGALPVNTIASALSPDGEHVYVYGSDHHIKRLNSTTLTELMDWSATQPAGNVSQGILMTMSPDGGTLFVAGTDFVLIENVP
jgi:hypothetical protein